MKPGMSGLRSGVAPSRVRGLKPPPGGGGKTASGRTLTGAWIETRSFSWASLPARGRTLTGAWIETEFEAEVR